MVGLPFQAAFPHKSLTTGHWNEGWVQISDIELLAYFYREILVAITFSRSLLLLLLGILCCLGRWFYRLFCFWRRFNRLFRFWRRFYWLFRFGGFFRWHRRQCRFRRNACLNHLNRLIDRSFQAFVVGNNQNNVELSRALIVMLKRNCIGLRTIAHIPRITDTCGSTLRVGRADRKCLAQLHNGRRFDFCCRWLIWWWGGLNIIAPNGYLMVCDRF